MHATQIEKIAKFVAQKQTEIAKHVLKQNHSPQVIHTTQTDFLKLIEMNAYKAATNAAILLNQTETALRN